MWIENKRYSSSRTNVLEFFIYSIDFRFFSESLYHDNSIKALIIKKIFDKPDLSLIFNLCLLKRFECLQGALVLRWIN